jgi:signal transduction histidine kinase
MFMMKSFKYTVAGIIVGLILVFAWQLYWLSGLYVSIETETIRDVVSCMEVADLDELQYRMEVFQNKPENRNVSSLTALMNTALNDDKANTEKITTTVVIDDKDTITLEYPNNNASAKLLKLNDMMKVSVSTLHQIFDATVSVDLNRFDSLMINRLENKMIDVRYYYSEIIDLNTNTVIRTSLADSLFNKSTQSFIYRYNSYNSSNYAHKIYTTPLTKTILIRMGGIIAATILIIIILGFAFRYFIVTVMRQKTLEEMKDDFTNNMTHELKTPIAVAYSAADVLLNFGKDFAPEKRNQYIGICKDQMALLGGLVEQILSMSMEQRKTFVLNKEEIQIKDLITALVNQHKLKTGKDIVFNIDIEPENRKVKADRTHLNNILSNLIDNAIKYSPGEVRIDIRVYENKQYTVIEIKDDGAGISYEKQRYIFDKFYRVPAGNQYNIRGYGLGLFYVKTMTEKHGGRVSVQSIPGKGSVFTVEIPSNG